MKNWKFTTMFYALCVIGSALFYGASYGDEIFKVKKTDKRDEATKIELIKKAMTKKIRIDELMKPIDNDPY
jgi:hypothetical protein